MTMLKITNLITSTLEDVAFELLDDSDLFVYKDMLDGLLDDTATVHLQGELEDVTFHSLDESELLAVVGDFESFLHAVRDVFRLSN